MFGILIHIFDILNKFRSYNVQGPVKILLS